MIEKTIITNGTLRTISGKRFGDEFRIYSINGDVSDREELAEMVQELAMDLTKDGVTSVTLRA